MHQIKSDASKGPAARIASISEVQEREFSLAKLIEGSRTHYFWTGSTSKHVIHLSRRNCASLQPTPLLCSTPQPTAFQCWDKRTEAFQTTWHGHANVSMQQRRTYKTVRYLAGIAVHTAPDCVFTALRVDHRYCGRLRLLAIRSGERRPTRNSRRRRIETTRRSCNSPQYKSSS